MYQKICIALLAMLGFTTASVRALPTPAPTLWVHDSTGNLGTVDVSTGTVNVVGNMGVVMTDIGFDPSGQLFGLSFTRLYSINKSTGSSALIGPHGIPSGNALVFGTDGTLYGAGGASTSLFTLNVLTGAGTNIGNIGASSAGDLAFNGTNFFMSSTSNNLVEIDLGGVSGATVGPIGFSSVFGLATANDGVTYGVTGTTILSIDLATGAGSVVSDYGGQGLGASFGSSFLTEAGAPDTTAVPEPITATLSLMGLVALGIATRRRVA